MEGKIIEDKNSKIYLGYRKDVPKEEVKLMEEIIKKAIKNSEKPRCKACVSCPMGVVGCEWDDKPHGHGCTQVCPECGISFYHIHPHSNTCSKATPVTDDVRHDEHNMKWQFKKAAIEETFKNKTR